MAAHAVLGLLQGLVFPVRLLPLDHVGAVLAQTHVGEAQDVSGFLRILVVCVLGLVHILRLPLVLVPAAHTRVDRHARCCRIPARKRSLKLPSRSVARFLPMNRPRWVVMGGGVRA
jgi:hypothetical protein